MPADRLDTAPLVPRPTGPDWRDFKRAARAGDHGSDLAVPGSHRYRYAILTVLLLLGLPAVPAGLLLTEGVTLLSVSMSALWTGGILLTALVALGVRRLDHWGPKTRERYRLTRFAHANGLDYEPTPDVPRPAADLFDSASPTRAHLDRLTAPGPGGFLVANYREERDWEGAESYWSEAGYAVFRLRETLPHFFAARHTAAPPRRLRSVTPTDGADGYRVWCANPGHPPLARLLDETRLLGHVSRLGGTTQVEIVGDQLFLVHRGGFWPLASPAFWAATDATAEALSPFLAPPTERPDG
ncbi:hypothetical protein E0L36_10875 [Streptomyces sp. AJS327]|uniref:hypothetical protein n=1 Tax=Streptomyces sp. AJS327 TaxID=2545265 RepID=UPI0015DDE100|nr:hypothetical protein [Streptomyces sp. AJS327]MBA0051373.1 hypothetical protein [Streptomyces sp. AJS327]